MKKLPLIRTSDIVFQESDNEVLLYDLSFHKAYCLNETTAIVWRHCDGKTSIDEFAAKQKLPEEIVLLALKQLSKENLLTEKVEMDIPSDKVSRRKLIALAGAMSVALPLLTVVIAPTSAQIGSMACVPNNDPLIIGNFPTQMECTDALAVAVIMGCCSGQAGVFLYGTLPGNVESCVAICGMIVA